MNSYHTIAFDADDTLWVNEPYFRQAEEQFCGLLEDYLSHHRVGQELFKIEMQNLDLYGYGVKAFMLSMIETILEVTEGNAPIQLIEKAIAIGKEQLQKPIELLDDIEEVLAKLSQKYRLIVATKGDLLDQERKLTNSGLSKYFHHVEVMSNKKEANYEKLLRQIDCPAEQFLMIGNSLKSDILPVLNLGGHAIHVPYHTTWVHEEIDHQIEHSNFREVKKIRTILDFL